MTSTMKTIPRKKQNHTGTVEEFPQRVQHKLEMLRRPRRTPTTPQRQARVLAMTAVRGPAPRRPAQDDDLEAKYFAELVLAAVQKPGK